MGRDGRIPHSPLFFLSRVLVARQMNGSLCTFLAVLYSRRGQSLGGTDTNGVGLNIVLTSRVVALTSRVACAGPEMVQGTDGRRDVGR